MRVTALLPGCLQRTQGFQVPMDRIQSVRDYIFYTNEGYVMQSQRSKLALHNADFSPLQWTWADCCFRLCWSSGPEPESTPWTRKRTRWTMVRRLIDWFNYPVNAQTAKCLHRGERHRGMFFPLSCFPRLFIHLASNMNWLQTVPVSHSKPRCHRVCWLCSCSLSERRARKQGPERQWIFPGATTHTSYLWRSGRQNPF